MKNHIAAAGIASGSRAWTNKCAPVFRYKQLLFAGVYRIGQVRNGAKNGFRGVDNFRGNVESLLNLSGQRIIRNRFINIKMPDRQFAYLQSRQNADYQRYAKGFRCAL